MTRLELERTLAVLVWISLIAVAGLFSAGCTDRQNEPTFDAKEFFDRKDRESGGGGAP